MQRLTTACGTLKRGVGNPNFVTAYEYQNDSFGSFYTAFSAVQGKDGKPVALIGADYSLTQIYTEIIFYTAMRVLALFVVLAIVFLLVMRFVRKKMYNPILLIFEKIRGYFSDKADGTNTKKAFVPINSALTMKFSFWLIISTIWLTM